RCWGDNGAGQLGLGDTVARGKPSTSVGNGGALEAVDLGASRIVSMVGGYDFTCALLEDATISCWGANNFGQLGVGDVANRGDAAGQMGDALLRVDLGGGGSAGSALAISAGGGHACAILLDARSLKCWGYNANGQLGLGSTANRGGAADMGDALAFVDLGGIAVLHVSAGKNHTCVILTEGTVKCWGDNSFGQLGVGDSLPRGGAPGEMGAALPAVALGEGAVVVTTGDTHTCVILASGVTKCWGGNAFGQLGLGDTAARGSAAAHMGAALPPVDLGTDLVAVALAAGAVHTCALLNSSQVVCWGRNEFGALGFYDRSNALAAWGDSAGEMGDALVKV
ncbi:regulator of chromosome condensation 1/beta-lactamase-inhibitor protein II, partial [Baffinella frigidus]